MRVSKSKLNSVTVLSSFPPVKGISPYTVFFVEELEKHIPVKVISFKSIYPSFLYPGKTKYKSFEIPELANTKVERFITWYNPISWIIAGFKVKGDIFHVQWWSWFLSPVYWVILGIAKLRGKKIVMTIHNVLPHEKSFFKNFLTKSVIKLADKAIVHTQKNKKDLSKFLKKAPIEVIPHGIIRSKTAGISRKEARKEFGIDSDKKVLLFFGNIRAYKGLDDLLMALSKLKGDYKLIIAGKCWEKWWKYQKIIDECKLFDHVLRLNEFIPEEKVEALYKASDLLILPYKHFDAQSGVGALSLFFEMPILVSRIGGLTDLAVSEDFIYEAGNTDELAKRIKGFFDNKESFIEDIRKKKKEFMWDNIIEKTMSFYEE